MESDKEDGKAEREQGTVETPRYNFGPALRNASPPLLPPRPVTPAPRPVLKSPGALLAAALGVGAAWETLLYENRLGIGFPLWMGCGLAALILLAGREGVSVRWRNVLPLGIALLFFGAMVAVRSDSTVTLLNIALCGLLSALLARLLTTGEISRLTLRDLLGSPWQILGHAFVDAAPVLRDFIGRLPGGAERKERALIVGRGLLLTVPVLSVFVALLYSADALFARYVSDIGNWLFPSDFIARLERIGLVLGVSYLATGKLAYTLTPREPRTETSPPRTWIGFAEGMMLLGSVTLVFIAFVAIQFAYLFGGNDQVLRVPGLTYAEYARHGFAELVWVSVLTAALLQGVRVAVCREVGKQENTFRLLGTLLVALTLVILESASRRMALYEAAYGATETRLYVDSAIRWLGLALVFLSGTLWLPVGKGSSFLAALLFCGAGFVATLDLQNPEAKTVQANWLRYQATGKLDINYLGSSEFSEDADPELLRLIDSLPPKQGAAIACRLRQDLKRLREQRQQDRFPAFHVARERAYRALCEAEPRLVERCKETCGCE